MSAKWSAMLRVASSVSPCTVAAVPLVVAYVGGSRRRAFFYALAFVLGLSLALVAGVSLLSGRALPGIGGGYCGQSAAIPWKGALGAFVTGALSGVVFAPCATPVMVGILALIGNQQDVLFGTLLMFLYSLGHGALLLAAGSSVGFAQWVAHSRWAERVNWLFTRLAGALLVAYALYLAIDRLGLGA